MPLITSTQKFVASLLWFRPTILYKCTFVKVSNQILQFEVIFSAYFFIFFSQRTYQSWTPQNWTDLKKRWVDSRISLRWLTFPDRSVIGWSMCWQRGRKWHHNVVEVIIIEKLSCVVIMISVLCVLNITLLMFFSRVSPAFWIKTLIGQFNTSKLCSNFSLTLRS